MTSEPAAPRTPRPPSRGGAFDTPGWRVALPIGAVLVVVAVKVLVGPAAWHDTPFLLFFMTVAFAVWRGGPVVAAAVLAISAAASWYFFLRPSFSFALTDAAAGRLGLFLLEGSAIAAVGVALQNARQRAAASEERFMTTLNSIGDAVVATDGLGRVSFMNPVAERLTGWTAAEAVGRPLPEVFRIVNEDTRRSVENPVDKVLRDGEIVGLANHTALLSRSGEEYAIEDSGAPIRDGRGRIEGVVLVFRDVTEKRRANERAHFLAAASELLLGSLDINQTLRRVTELAVPRLADWASVYLADDSGGLTSVAAQHADPAKVQQLEELQRKYPPRPDKDAGLLEVVRTQKTLTVRELSDERLAESAHDPEHLAMLRDLGLRSVLLVPMIARGITVGVIAFAQADPRRRLEEADVRMAEDLAQRAAIAVDNAHLYLQAQDAVRARDEFLSIASHELKTPLTPLQLQLDNLERTIGRSDLDRTRIADRLEQANRQTRRLTRLVESLLDVSRITLGKMTIDVEEFDFVEMAREVVERFRPEAARAGCMLELHGSLSLPGSWDRLRIEQVLGNLITNSVKYGAGKPIDVTVDGTEDTVRLTVEDHGIGISAQDSSRIFGRFERAVSARHYGGLGLGLYIARQISEAHGGTIVVQSQPGSGAVFTVVLPRAPLTIDDDRPVRARSRGLT